MDHYFTNNNNLKSEIKNIRYSYNNYEFLFVSDNGVFSKMHIDEGSKTLVNSFLKNYSKSGKILDMGCGYGFIGIVTGKILDSMVTFADVNKRALHLAKMNIDSNCINGKVLESNCYENINETFDVIITNPPVRAGKETLLKILIDAKNHLNDDGELWYVLRKDQGAKSIEKVLNEHYSVSLVEKNKGFYIYCCKKC